MSTHRIFKKINEGRLPKHQMRDILSLRSVIRQILEQKGYKSSHTAEISFKMINDVLIPFEEMWGDGDVSDTYLSEPFTFDALKENIKKIQIDLSKYASKFEMIATHNNHCSDAQTNNITTV